MRHERKPSLEDQRDNACPVEEQTRGEMLFHIMPVDVVHNERKRVQEGENEKSVRDPSVEDLKSLMGDASEQSDPVRLACCCT